MHMPLLLGYAYANRLLTNIEKKSFSYYSLLHSRKVKAMLYTQRLKKLCIVSSTTDNNVSFRAWDIKSAPYHYRKEIFSLLSTVLPHGTWKKLNRHSTSIEKIHIFVSGYSTTMVHGT